MAPVKFFLRPAAAHAAGGAGGGGAGGGAASAGGGSDGGKIAVRVSNRYDFLSTAHLAFEWRAVLLGEPAAVGAAAECGVSGDGGGWQRLDGAPVVESHSEGALALPLTRAGLLAALRAAHARAAAAAGAQAGPVPPLPPRASDALVEVRAVLRAAAPWAPAGHAVAAAQLAPLSDADVAAADDDGDIAAALRRAAGGAGRLAIERRPDGGVRVTGPGGLAVEVCGRRGCITSLERGGAPLLVGALEPCLMRASTDNDRGGSGGASYLARWVAAGLDRLDVAEGLTRLAVVADGSGGGGASGASGSGGCVELEAELTLRPSAALEGAAGSVAGGAGVGETGGAHWMAAEDAATTAAPAAEHGARSADGNDGGGGAHPKEAEVRVEARYRVWPGGLVETEWRIDASAALPAPPAPGLRASLPRVGLRAAVAARAAARAEWRGRGPHECYPDRRFGARLGRHAAALGDLATPYVWPQENGGRADVSWAALTGAGAGAGGLAFVCTHNATPAAWPSAADAARDGASAAAAAAIPDAPAWEAAQAAGPALQLFSAARHSWRELDAARHQHELKAADCDGGAHGGGVVHVHLDAAHMGVGGDDSWSPSVHAAYLVAPREYAFGIALLPLTG